MTSLPEPSPAARAHSAQLADLIRAEIRAHDGAISFRRFMELALYAPGLGYYMAGARKFGVDGDFVTAPEISPLFARCIARQCAQVLQHLGGGELLEIGAGSGALAADLLLELETLGALPTRYRILELSGELRARQRETLGARASHLAPCVEWLDALPNSGFRGVILGNEVLDAIPAARFCADHTGIHELYVALDNDTFIWRTGAASDASLSQRLSSLRATLPLDYVSEVNLAAEAWIHSIATMLERGLALLIDYGFPAHEFYHPQRATGTLMCHYRHHAHPDPFTYIGLQDITTHVDFSAIAHAAHAAGLHVAGFTTQAYFLLATGIHALTAHAEMQTRERLPITQQINKLTSPAEMGELFKVLALTRGINLALLGFEFRDQRARL